MDSKAMNHLEPENIPGFLKQFGDFHDAILRSINIKFRSREHKSSVDIVLSVADQLVPGTTNDWVNLHLQVTDVVEFSFVEGSISYQVVFELNIRVTQDWLVLDFDGSDGPSKFFIKGSRCDWEILPYAEW